MKLYVLTGDYESETTRIGITFKEKNVEEITQKIADTIGKPPNDFLLYVLSFEENIYPFLTTPKTELFSKIDTLSSSIFVIELTEADKALENRVELPCRFSKKEYSRYESFWFKRPFYFDFERATGLDILKRVLRYLYNDTYDFSHKRIEKENSKVKWRKNSEE